MPRIAATVTSSRSVGGNTLSAITESRAPARQIKPNQCEARASARLNVA
ncbi:hypothetical protein [Cryobacterium sp. PAMC25264]|nr:hypothetical protein [Cryobacterium sp. PAMC25264]QYF73720.1 hypothetical protein KY500_00010 [Cryobacterium sp. PAMC25264]